MPRGCSACAAYVDAGSIGVLDGVSHVVCVYVCVVCVCVVCVLRRACEHVSERV